MAKSPPTRFSVRPENRDAAITHLKEHGYFPMCVEEDENGLAVLIFAALPDDKMLGLVQALPIHLSAKIGIVVGNQPPFLVDGTNGS